MCPLGAGGGPAAGDDWARGLRPPAVVADLLPPPHQQGAPQGSPTGKTPTLDIVVCVCSQSTTNLSIVFYGRANDFHSLFT